MAIDVEALSAELVSEREWRTKELTDIKWIYMFMSHRGLKQKHLDLYLKMNIPMIYAYWEGFVVATYKIVFDYLNRLELDPRLITINLLTYANQESYNSLKGKHSFKQKCKFTDKFLGILENKMQIGNRIDTKSNLKYDVLIELLQIFEIDESNFSQYKPDLDRLVNVRNAIAHGENSIEIRYEDISYYIEIITEIMDKLILELVYYIENEKFRKR